MSNIDWFRLHRPQADGYDTAVIAQLAKERYGFEKRLPEPGQPSMFDGRVPLIHLPQRSAEWLDHAPFDHPNIALTEEFLKRVWPEVAEQAANLLQEIYIMSDPRHEKNLDMSGCTCGNINGWGGISSTVQGVIGFAHGIVHEMGHWKLHAMGVHLEDWDNLVANSFDELFESPIRKDKPRPMGACIQAQYSYLHVLELEIRAWKAGRQSDMMALNVQRMTAGREVLKSWKPDLNGIGFAAAMDVWADELISEATALLLPPART